MEHQTFEKTFNEGFTKFLSGYAVFATLFFFASVIIGDIIVPNHNWISDTISDLAAGQYSIVVDLGLYIFATGFLAVAMLTSHGHLGGPRWSAGTFALAVLALIVFMIGSRDEYGDSDQDGVVIHRYLVYALGFFMAVIPWLLSGGVSRISGKHGNWLIGVSIVWIITAPIFFMLPDDVDGIYERALGLISFTFIAVMAHLYWQLATGKTQSSYVER
ncbi:DUF998 domain-containing protein [Yoonia litorea]|uniref:DUF998 domain-containing protein n=1 Tax=Yoonia litorea TaxID=1123755 RepID=A0A1I6MZT0_9RHOB|nr:DUF998 domain-containing protein [Yoonia litorea]SFS21203.1 Protein of unknown function [Yoonia litorea]